METQRVQDLVEQALENAIDTLDLLATDDGLDRRLREAQDNCNRALIELRGYGHEPEKDEWKNN